MKAFNVPSHLDPGERNGMYSGYRDTAPDSRSGVPQSIPICHQHLFDVWPLL